MWVELGYKKLARSRNFEKKKRNVLKIFEEKMINSIRTTTQRTKIIY